MTNFEKWKQELTVGEMANIIQYLAGGLECSDCPAHCPDCKGRFTKWANQEIQAAEDCTQNTPCNACPYRGRPHCALGHPCKADFETRTKMSH